MNSHADNLLILGAGDLALEAVDLAGDISGVEVVGFAVNDRPELAGTSLNDLPIYWVDDLEAMAGSVNALCAIATTHRASFIEQVEGFGLTFKTLVHPTARVSPSTSIGAGSIISSGVQIASKTRIGRHVIVNRGALIGHDCHIDDYATISPGANLAGKVSVGRRTWIGLGANIVQGISIGSRSIIGAGSLVLRDVPDKVKAMGSPAVILEREVDGL